MPFDPTSAEGVDDTLGHFFGYFDQRELISHVDRTEDTGIYARLIRNRSNKIPWPDAGPPTGSDVQFGHDR